MCERCVRFNVVVENRLILRRAEFKSAFLHGQRDPVENVWRTGWKFDEQLMLNHRGEWEVLMVRCHEINTVFAIDVETFTAHAELIVNTLYPMWNEYYVYAKHFLRATYPKDLNPNGMTNAEWLTRFRQEFAMVDA